MSNQSNNISSEIYKALCSCSNTQISSLAGKFSTVTWTLLNSAISCTTSNKVYGAQYGNISLLAYKCNGNWNFKSIIW